MDCCKVIRRKYFVSSRVISVKPLEWMVRNLSHLTWCCSRFSTWLNNAVALVETFCLPRRFSVALMMNRSALDPDAPECICGIKKCEREGSRFINSFIDVSILGETSIPYVLFMSSVFGRFPAIVFWCWNSLVDSDDVSGEVVLQ